MDTSISSRSTQYSIFVQQLPDQSSRLQMNEPDHYLHVKFEKLPEILGQIKLMFPNMSLREFSALLAHYALKLDAPQGRFPSQMINSSPIFMQRLKAILNPPQRDASNEADLPEGNMMPAEVYQGALAVSRRRREAYRNLSKDIESVSLRQEQHERHLLTAKLTYENQERKFREELKLEKERLCGKLTTYFDVLKEIFLPGRQPKPSQRVVHHLSQFGQPRGGRFNYGANR